MPAILVRASLPWYCGPGSTATAARGPTAARGLRSCLRRPGSCAWRVGVRCNATTPPEVPGDPPPAEVPGTARPPEELPSTNRPPEEMPGIDAPPEFNAPPGVDVPMPGAPVPEPPPGPEQPGPSVPLPPRPEIPAVPRNPDVPLPPPEVDPPMAPPEVVPPQPNDVPPPFV